MLPALAACALAAAPLHAAAEQTPADQADPSVVEDELRDEAPQPSKPRRIVEAPAVGESATAVTEPVLAGAIRIDGTEALPQAAFAGVVERYVGRTLSSGDLRALASDIAAAARGSGYGLATAWIPPQRVANGLLRVRLDEGRIDAVEVTGSGRAAAERRLAPLADGRPIRTSELERRLLLAEDAAGVRMGKARLVRRKGRNVLVVSARQERVEGRASLDNWGSSTAGPVRARLSIDLNGVFAADDRLSLDGVVTPLQPDEFALVRAGYTAAVGNDGTEVSVGGYVARSEAGGALSDRDLDGDSTEVEAEVRHPLVRSREGSVWASVGAKLRDSGQTRDDVAVRDDRLATVTASAYAFRQLEGGRLRGRVSLVQGLGILGATRMGDPLASRADADGAFTKFELWGEYEQRLGYDFSFLFQAEAQFADGPLLSSEEMGLGGRWFGRAWDYREFSGDRGAAGALEVRYLWKRPASFVEAAQLYLYADGGSVGNYAGGGGGGSLASAGGGVRLWLPSRVRASLELGVPLTDGGQPARDDDPRVSMTLDKKF
jgi:hemolysin activation/secretion protein